MRCQGKQQAQLQLSVCATQTLKQSTLAANAIGYSGASVQTRVMKQSILATTSISKVADAKCCDCLKLLHISQQIQPKHCNFPT